MRKRMLAYLKYIDMILKNELAPNSAFDDTCEHTTSLHKDIVPTRKDYERLLSHHLEQISFFQHERLIHLLVTVLFALLTFAAFFLCLLTFHPGLFVLFLALLILLIPYIRHYYLLENGVQKMYRQYDEIVKKLLL